MWSLKVVKNFDNRFNLILGNKFGIGEKKTETGLIEFNPFMPGGNKRLKLQGCSSVYRILLPSDMKGLKTTYICRFYCLYQRLQTVILYRVPGNVLIPLFS